MCMTQYTTIDTEQIQKDPTVENVFLTILYLFSVAVHNSYPHEN